MYVQIITHDLASNVLVVIIRSKHFQFLLIFILQRQTSVQLELSDSRSKVAAGICEKCNDKLYINVLNDIICANCHKIMRLLAAANVKSAF